MKHIIDAVHRAAQETTEFITGDIQAHAKKVGWSSDAASSVSVKYHEGQFSAVADSDSAFLSEYGTESARPKPAVRSYAKSSPAAEAALLGNVAKHVGGLL